MRRITGWTALAALFATLPARAANVITDLGTLGGAGAAANAVNDSGQVAGTAGTGSAAHAFRYSGGVMTDLGTLGGSISFGLGINEAGDVVGSSWLPGDTGRRAVLWSGGSMTDLGTLGGDDSTAHDINDAGEIAGVATTTANTTHRPFRYGAGTMTDLGTFGGMHGTAYGINAGGDVAGEAGDILAGPHAFRWSGGTMTDVGGAGSVGFAINAGGDVVGVANQRAKLFAGGTTIDLGTPSAFRSSAYDVDDGGRIVGDTVGTDTFGFDVETTRRAFVYNAGAVLALDRLLPPGSGWLLRTARGVSNAGHIVGSGALNGGEGRAFLLTLAAGCGNGLLDAGEGCDDGNGSNGDGCSASCVEEAAWQCEGQPSACRTSDHPLDGLKLIVKRTPKGDKLVFVSKDPSVFFPAAGGGDDPAVVGAYVDVFSDTEWPGTLALPAAGWITGTTVHKFVHPTAPDALSAVRIAKLKQGAFLKVQARAVPFDLLVLQEGMGVRVRTGSGWNCARFGPPTVVREQTSPTYVFVARNASGGDLSDCSESSLH